MSAAADSIMAAIMLLVVAITAIFGYMFLTQLDTGMQNVQNYDSYYITQGKAALKVFDYMAVFFAVSLGLGVIMAAFMVPTHPVFAMVAIVLLAVQVLVSGMVANVFADIVTANSTVLAAANEFSMLVTLFQNLPVITLLFGALAIVVAYGKTSASPSASTGEI